MNILFVVNSLSEVAGANVNIVRTLIRLLKQKNCVISILAKSDCRRPASELIKKEFDYAYLLPSDRYEIVPNHYKTLKIKNKKLKEILWIINHPGILWKGIDIKFLNAYWTRKEYTKCIEKICKEKKIHAVIGVSAPYEIARAVSSSKIDSIKALYQLDPYTNNYTFNEKNKEKRRKIEKKTINNLDLVFAPDFIKNDILISDICLEYNKIVEANLPGIIIDNMVQFEAENISKKDENYINMVFAGRLYEDIRNPKSLLDLMAFLPENYRLHIFGYGCEKQVKESKNKLGSKLIYHGLVPKNEADEYVNNADVLINIDNSIKNQMPSKIVDYICQCKKIINICLDKECLAAKLLTKYPNGLNVCINERTILENAKMIETFIKKDIKKITTKEIIDNYKEYTDQYVADVLLVTLQKFIDNNIKN